MEDISLATLVAKLEVQHQYTKDALTEIKNTLSQYLDQHQDLDRRVSDFKSDQKVVNESVQAELRVIRKVGAIALSIVTTVLGGLALAVAKLFLGL